MLVVELFSNLQESIEADHTELKLRARRGAGGMARPVLGA